jgi:hypothetical protein
MSKLNNTKILITFIFHFSLLLPVFSQNTIDEKQIMVCGTVYNKFSLDSLPFTSVSINGKLGFVTDEEGNFVTNLLNTDTLIFSHLGYFDTKIVLSELGSSDILYVNVLMEKKVYEISEAIIRPYNTYAEFKQALLELDTSSKGLSNSEVNIYLLITHLRAGYLVEKDSYGNYRNDLNLRYIDNKSVVLFSSAPHRGLIPALKKAFGR